MRGRYTSQAVLAVLVVVVLAVAGIAPARQVDPGRDVPGDGSATRTVQETVWFQGFLADYPSGDPVNATYNIVARIYGVPGGGVALWGPETHNGVNITQGWFNIELGSIAGPLPPFDTPPYFVELTVNGEVLDPRLKLASVPTALHTASAEGDWEPIEAGIVYHDTVAIGTYDPDELLTVRPVSMGDDAYIHIGPRVILDGDKGDGRSGDGALIGMADGSPNLYAVNTEEGGGLWMGASAVPSHAIVDSSKTLISPLALMYGTSPFYFMVDGGSIGEVGGAFFSNRNSDVASALYAEYYGDNAYATAVYGDATAGDQWTIGGEFTGNGTGVDGLAQWDGDDSFLYGVYGSAFNNGNSPCYSIYGAQPISATGAEFAGFFAGDCSVTGTFWNTLAASRIDHPMDPANMYLQHSFVESPDMMNVYNGNVVLDSAGEATVVLPDYFEAYNRDFRYQLTPIGAPGPNLYIATEIAGNSFRIAGGVPGSKVSWLVTGVRNDALAESKRLEVEVQKKGYEAGRYVNPEAYGLPASMSTFYNEAMETARVEKAAIRAERKAREAERREQAKAGESAWGD